MDDTTGRVAGNAVEDASLTPEVEVRAVEIRAEIADTRDDISETIDAIQERLSPAHIAQQAKDAVRHATTDKVKQMANSAGNGTNTILPIAMIGIGAGWLLSNRRSRTSEYGYRQWNSGGAGYGGRNYAADDYAASDYSGSGAYRSSEAVGTRGTFDAQGTADELRDTARRTTRRAQMQFQDVLQNNPLMLGAAAALIGAVIGMSVPATETENEWLGEARDTVIDRAKDMASSAADQVSNAASQVTGQQPANQNQRS